MSIRRLRRILNVRESEVPWILKNRYWLGRHESKGAILVKRPVSGSPRIDVWFYEQRRWVDCNREIMRSKVFDDLSSDFVKEAESALIKKENIELELKHEAHLQKHGLSSAGTKKREATGPARFTHCWSCKQNIDSFSFLECSRCGWILCNCGACGCGRQ